MKTNLMELTEHMYQLTGANNAFSLYGGSPVNVSNATQTGNQNRFVDHSTVVGYPTLKSARSC